MGGTSNQPPQGDRAPQNGFVSKRLIFPATKHPLFIVAGLTAVFLFFLLGYYIGRSDMQDSYSVVVQKELPAETDGSDLNLIRTLSQDVNSIKDPAPDGVIRP